MKSKKEILSMLVEELTKHLDKVKSVQKRPQYFNELLGDTSFLLAGLLESLLKEKFSDWKNGKWIDDSLISNVVIQKDKLALDGVMIWGKENTTKQWTDLFSFEITLLSDKNSSDSFTFLFCDRNNPEVSYEEFRDNRDRWEKSNRSWKYVINE